MLTKEALRNGAYLASLDDLDGLRWSEERILASLVATLATRPRHGALWVFGYGSLMWNPLLDFDAREVASLPGWHRSFCLRMLTSRGSPRTPGRMLAVEPGGETLGLAFRLRAESFGHDLPCIWRREMVFGSYRPQWQQVILADGSPVQALVFVADPAYALYEADSRAASIAHLLAGAHGQHGSNAEYLHLLHEALAEHGLRDAYIDALAEAMAQHLAGRAPP